MPLTLFNGERLSYAYQRTQMITLACSMDSDNNAEFGLLGYLLTTRDYTSYILCQNHLASNESNSISVYEFNEIENPGKCPVIPNDLTTDTIVFHKFKYDVWKNANASYNKQQSEIKSLHNHILSSLPKEVQNSIGHPDSGFILYTSPQILARLDAFFIAATTADFLELKTLLQKPFLLSDNFEMFVISHRSIHSYCLTSGQPMSENDKMHTFILAVNHSHVFTPIIDHYTISNPTYKTFHFEGLVAILRDNIKRIRYALTLTVPPAIPSVFSKKPEVASAAVTAKKAKWTPEEKALKYTHYCWTHGPLCSHKSVDCRKKDPGHRDEATLDNTCGGRTTAWVPKKAK